MHEFELIKNYFQKLSKKSSSSLNLNDDVFFDTKIRLVVSVDTYIEGNHFVDFKNPNLVIKKIIRSSISDLHFQILSVKVLNQNIILFLDLVIKRHFLN